MAYLIKKNGMYLSQIFCDPARFEAHAIRHAYMYTNEQIAQDIATKQGAELVKVYQPGAPFGDWELVPTFTIVGFYESNGQIFSHHVQSASGAEAFAVVHAMDSDAVCIAAIEGELQEGEGIEFSGDRI